ncbi:MAG: hypothetical protein GX149_02850 [Acholeplasmataceae bacterium]|jgi:hypothetical protein|nr:hypothetical protein [Acholeplasmataceae bacterium]
MQNEFSKILDDNETIIAAFKPNKFKFYFLNIFFFTTGWIFIFLIFLLIYLFPEDFSDQMPAFVFLILLGIFLVAAAIDCIFLMMTYNKRFYAYSNKRIIIKSGLIGVDYKSLDHKMIGAIDVRVDLSDKIVRRNTGSLRFGSQASPLAPQGALFRFSGIEDPYVVYRSIKKYIDSVKEQ